MRLGLRMLHPFRRRIVSIIPHGVICLTIWLLLIALYKPREVIQRNFSQQDEQKSFLPKKVFDPSLKSKMRIPGSPQNQQWGVNRSRYIDHDFMMQINSDKGNDSDFMTKINRAGDIGLDFEKQFNRTRDVELDFMKQLNRARDIDPDFMIQFNRARDVDPDFMKQLNRSKNIDPDSMTLMSNTKDKDFMTWINEKRIEMVDKECLEEDVGDGVLKGVYIHQGTNLAYCPLAKVGCTFWKRIFLFLSNDTGSIKVNHPFQIPRMLVHYGQKNKTQIIKHPISGQFLGNFTRILFVRDPYSRLWSAYLDKIYLPDFWPTHAMRIVSVRHRSANMNVTVCPKDVTFEEFLGYITQSDPRRLNEHWQPVKYRCDPCTLKPDFIGKMETFGRDAGFLLGRVGMTWVTRDLDHDALANRELKTLIDYNFSLLKHKFFKRCLSYSDIAHRLLNVFKINGYIPSSVVAPDWFRAMSRQSVPKYREYILNMHRTVGQEGKVLLIQQRRQAFREAFQHIPLSIFERLTTIFKTDFTAFGYDTTPPHLNPNV